MPIDHLIDKQDGFEIVRDQIAAILKSEIENQKILAAQEGKTDLTPWDLRVFSERVDPWESFREDKDTRPIVNVWFDNSTYPKNQGNVVDGKNALSVFNVDLLAVGSTSFGETEGQRPGDMVSAYNVHAAARLIRNILMASIYTYLGLRGFVGQRWLTSLTSFQPAAGSVPVEKITAVRLSLEVQHLEYSPQSTPVEIEGVLVDVYRSETGELYLQAEYDYTEGS